MPRHVVLDRYMYMSFFMILFAAITVPLAFDIITYTNMMKSVKTTLVFMVVVANLYVALIGVVATMPDEDEKLVIQSRGDWMQFIMIAVVVILLTLIVLPLSIMSRIVIRCSTMITLLCFHFTTIRWLKKMPRAEGK